MASITITDEDIFEMWSGMISKDDCFKSAEKMGKPYMIYDCIVYLVSTREPIFFNPNDWGRKDAPPFVGWKQDYFYIGARTFLNVIDLNDFDLPGIDY